jgi:dTMP kinase
MDRSRDSSVVYQGMVRGFGVEIVEQLNDISTKKTYPDYNFLLDAPVEIGLKRRMNLEGANRIDYEAKDFHEKIRQAYLQVAKADQQNMVRIRVGKLSMPLCRLKQCRHNCGAKRKISYQKLKPKTGKIN